MSNPAFVPVDHHDEEIYLVNVYYKGFSDSIICKLAEIVGKYENNACYITRFTEITDKGLVTTMSFADIKARNNCIENLNAVLFEPKKSVPSVRSVPSSAMKIVGNIIVQQGGTTTRGGMTFHHEGKSFIHGGIIRGTTVDIGKHSIVLPANYTTFHPSRDGVMVDGELYFDPKRADIGYWPDRKKEADKITELEHKIKLLELTSPVAADYTDDNDSGKCIICLSEIANIMFIKCCHVCFCENCNTDSYTEDICPMCRTHSKRKMVYLS